MQNWFKAEIGNIKFESPVILASGTAGYGIELEGIVDFTKIGGIVTKGISMQDRQGNPPPRISEFSINGTTIGLLNSIGLQNPGVKHFTKKILPQIMRLPTMVIVNVFGETEKEYAEVIKFIENESDTPPHAYELNLSCPNTEKGGIEFGVNTKSVAKIVCKTRKVTKRPIIVKFSPFSEIIKNLMKTAIDEGADAFTLVNSIPAAVRDQKGFFFKGGLSGPVLKPIALRCIIEAKEKFPDAKIIGCGGIYSEKDAVEFLDAGAILIQIGTANFLDPQIGHRIAEKLINYFKEKSQR